MEEKLVGWKRCRRRICGDDIIEVEVVDVVGYGEERMRLWMMEEELLCDDEIKKKNMMKGGGDGEDGECGWDRGNEYDLKIPPSHFMLMSSSSSSSSSGLYVGGVDFMDEDDQDDDDEVWMWRWQRWSIWYQITSSSSFPNTMTRLKKEMKMRVIVTPQLHPLHPPLQVMGVMMIWYDHKGDDSSEGRDGVEMNDDVRALFYHFTLSPPSLFSGTHLIVITISFFFKEYINIILIIIFFFYISRSDDIIEGVDWIWPTHDVIICRRYHLHLSPPLTTQNVNEVIHDEMMKGRCYVIAWPPSPPSSLPSPPPKWVKRLVLTLFPCGVDDEDDGNWKGVQDMVDVLSDVEEGEDEGVTFFSLSSHNHSTTSFSTYSYHEMWEGYWRAWWSSSQGERGRWVILWIYWVKTRILLILISSRNPSFTPEHKEKCEKISMGIVGEWTSSPPLHSSAMNSPSSLYPSSSLFSSFLKPLFGILWWGSEDGDGRKRGGVNEDEEVEEVVEVDDIHGDGWEEESHVTLVLFLWFWWLFLHDITQEIDSPFHTKMIISRHFQYPSTKQQQYWWNKTTHLRYWWVKY